MTKSTTEYVWDLLSKFPFELSDEKITDVFCTICHKIMIEPFAAKCGCQYCGGCIKDYLDREQTCCPGNKSDCREIVLKIDQNVFPNFHVRSKIIELNVVCPYEQCTVTTSLRNIEDHLRVCRFNQSVCPYDLIGCTDDSLNKKEVESHLSTEMCRHAELLMEALGNLRNDVEKLTKQLQCKETEMDKLREEIARLDKDKIGNEAVEEMFATKMDAIFTSVKEMRFYDEEEFLWKIDGFMMEDGFKRRSAPFYRNSYKMYLRLGVDEVSVGIGLYLMRGEFDGHLEWPLRCRVTLAVIDHETMAPFRSETYNRDTYVNEAFQRPQEDINHDCIGNNDFLFIDEMKEAKTLNRNNCLLVSCIVTAE